VAAFCLAKLKLSYDAWDGPMCLGPIPIIFSSDPVGVTTRMKAFPSLAHDIYQSLATRFFKPSVLPSIAEAISYLRSPTDPKSSRPLIKEWTEPPPQKKSKQDSHSNKSSGRLTGSLFNNNLLLVVCNYHVN